VVTFVSPTKVIGTLSDYYTAAWNVRAEADVTTDNNRISSVYSDGTFTNVVDCTISSITDKEMTWSSEWTTYVDGNQIAHESYSNERYVRVLDEYKDAILATWEGKSSDPIGEKSDTATHRWEYRTDGTFAYYNLVDGEWIAEDDILSEYFVDGVLLYTRWKKTADSEEQREWWEIDRIQDGVMTWKALRLREDGTSYEASFEMKKVD